jgi:hypothetical protein
MRYRVGNAQSVRIAQFFAGLSLLRPGKGKKEPAA